jgi:protein-export membrane protein SecD/preprotein translocase SecF subunit
MGEKNLWSKVGLIVLLVGLSIWQIWPPREKLKPGIDLGGGYSALFEIDDTGNNDPKLSERVMDILKQRIDPGSTRNLVWRPVGRNRLEIQMPRASGDTTARTQYEQIRKELLATNITESQIRAALAQAPAQRDAQFARLAMGIESRKALFDELAKVDDQYRRLTAEPSTRPAAESGPAAAAATQPVTTTQPAAATRPGEDLGDVIDARQAKINALLKTDLNVPGLLDRLELGKESKVRAQELAKLKEEHPALATRIDELVKAYDKWSQRKGVLEDPSDLLRLLRGAGVLEFRILATRDYPTHPDMLTSPNSKYNEPVARYMDRLKDRGPRPEAGDNYAWFKVAKPEENSIMHMPEYVTGQYLGTWYVLAHNTPDMGLLNDHTWSLVSAHPDRDPQTGRLAVAFQLDGRGGDQFSAMTGANLKRPLCIFLDSQAISAATIQSRISTRGQITGSFTPKEVSYLVQTLEAGALPARLKDVPIQERNVGPSLGESNIKWGLISVSASLAAVMIFMTMYYAYNGAIADIALLMNLIITLGAMSFLGATFTLPGLAGIILTLGMAVDANVLIFERMREELQRGVSAKMAVKLGYERAFSAIFDGNVTTILTAMILYWIGSEEIKGFGLTLSLGLAISMFTALFVTRQYYYIMVPLSLNREETRRAWWMPAILIAAGSFFVALAVAFHRQKGFGEFVLTMGVTALVLMASLWAFRWMYKALGHQKANRLPMMKLMSNPQIDWMTKYKKFWWLSGAIIGSGLIFMALTTKKEAMDIEFIGGTDVQVQLKSDQKLTNDQLMAYIDGNKQLSSVNWLKDAAGQVARATVTPAGESRYTVSMPGKYTSAQLQALLLSNLSQDVERNGVTPVAGGMAVQFDRQKPEFADVNRVRDLVQKDTADYLRRAAEKMAQARIQSVTESGQAAFDIVTTETSRSLVAESLMASMQDILEVKQPIEATLVTDAGRAPEGIFPIRRSDNVLSDAIGGESREDIAKYKGGLVMVFDNLRPADTIQDVQERLKQMRMQPEFESTGWRDFEVFGLGEPVRTTKVDINGKPTEAPVYQKIAIAVVDSNLVYDEDKPNDAWLAQVAQPEVKLAEQALASSQALQRVTQFAPQVASEAAQKAVIAVILAFIAIAGYLWVRFGSVDFGLSGIIALYHDVMVALAAVLACHYLYNTWLGHLLGLRDFKIDLTIIAALLTIIGYSINDSIVIFDRIRENRGRLGQISPALVNDSINQTLSRTILTVFTVFLVVLIMYVAGGEGIHGFAFVMLVGAITGTYSTIAVATPMVLHPRIMWGVTIFIAAVTAIGITWNISNLALRAIVVLLVAAVASYGAWRQYSSHRGEQEALPGAGRRPVKA